MSSPTLFAKTPRLAAALVLAAIGSATTAAKEGSTTVITSLAPGLTQTVTYGPVVLSETVNPVTGLPTITRTQDTFVIVDRNDHAETNPCPGSGETVLISGKTTLRFTIKTNGDGHLHESTHSDSHGQGVSLSGVKYVFGSTMNTSHNASTNTETHTTTQEDNFIRTTETTLPDDWYTHLTFHFTKVNGVTTTAWVDNYRAGCR